MERLWAGWRMAYLRADPPAGDDCVLCAIPGAGHVQSVHVVERAELTYTVLNLFPYASGHLMVVPYAHAAHVTDLDAATAAALIHGGQRAVRALERSHGPAGFNLGINHGRVAGAGIDGHCHLHVVPRWEGDNNFMPVLGDTRVLPEALDATADRIRAGYGGG